MFIFSVQYYYSCDIFILHLSMLSWSELIERYESITNHKFQFQFQFQGIDHDDDDQVNKQTHPVMYNIQYTHTFVHSELTACLPF